MSHARAQLPRDPEDRHQTNKNEPRGETIPLDEAETRMRESLLRLSLNDSGSAGVQATTRPSSPLIRRRFVRDGEVDVTVLRRGSEPGTPLPAELGRQLEAARAALADETAARNRATRSLEEATATIRTLQTKLHHAEMGRDDAIAALARQRDAEPAIHEPTEAEQDRLASTEEALQTVKQQLKRERHAHDAANQKVLGLERLVAELSGDRRAPIKKQAPVQETATPEPEPVAWWLNPPPKLKRTRTRRGAGDAAHKR
jgi:hypothetical protein